MLDFLKIGTRTKKDAKEIYPKFEINLKTKDLMTRGGDFYAVWDEENQIWSTEEQSVIDQVDSSINAYMEERAKAYPEEHLVPLLMRDSDSGSIDRWHKYVQKQMRTKFHPLDEKLIFSNQTVKKSDYVSKTLPYPLEDGDLSSYEELVSTLYSPSEREKFEWAIGAVISGDAKRIQKFEVFYGDKGTGKSTIFNIMEKLFVGFTSTFSAKDLGTGTNAFALEPFKNNPLVSIQHDGDLSRIEDNTRLNSIVSHEVMMMNAKYEKQYETRFNSFLFMGSNKPVKITDAKSGILRRLIDVSPTGNKIPRKKYDQLVSQIDFELGAIAKHCLDIYKERGHAYYDDYVPRGMMAATNDFYDFVDYYYDKFVSEDMVTLSDAWSMYQTYCEYAGSKRMVYRLFRLELQNYFREFHERTSVDGKQYRSLYKGFRRDRFEDVEKKKEDTNDIWINLVEGASLFDELYANAKAQIVTKNGVPFVSWDECVGVLSDIDTHKEHFAKPSDIHLICVDFDLKDESGKKDLQRNLEAASKWPKTYVETSRSGVALHLYYIYEGDVTKLSNIYADDIEIKTLLGNSSFRRKLKLCNDIPIATLKEGSLPYKEEKKVVDWNGYKDEKHLHNKIVQTIKENLQKNRGGSTTESINFIKEELDRAYESGLKYDVTDLQHDVLLFAMKSSNQAEHCVNLVGQMHFMSDDISEDSTGSDEPADERLVFFDWEVYPNFNCVVWKYDGSDTCTRIPFPTPADCEALMRFRLVGYNNRNYDNHITVGRARGYSDGQLYNMSQSIIQRGEGKIRGAENISYTDVLDFITEKMGLKKWEIRLREPHIEMGIPWDEDVPEELFETIMDYCENDVRTTEAVFHYREGDFMARKIQVDLVKLMHGDDIPVTVNDTTNTLSKRIVFGSNKNPQIEFNYRDMSKPVGGNQYEYYRKHFGDDYKFRVFDSDGLPLFRDYVPGEELPDGYSILPFFPGYTFDQYAKKDKSHYLGEVIGEGGRNYSVPGYHEWVWDGDIASQHPHSIMAEVLFGPRYTKVFAEIVEARVAVKHKDFEKAGQLLGGALKPYLNDETYKDLAQALKIVINSIYGLTSASFDNEFRDKRNIDNIVAKRGALFMTLLKREVEKRGFMVCHIKTDSIKIPHANDEIKDFILKFGREYGYEFETEAIFSKFAIFNDSAYVGWDTVEGEWVTKADQFKKEKQPYLFKTLFSHEPYVFDDFCETKSVQKGALYLDLNEDLGEPVDELYEKEKKKLDRMVAKANKDRQKDGFDTIDYTSEVLKEPEIAKQLDIVYALKDDIPNHHNYVFVGRVGRFTPVLPGAGGGKLYRFNDGKYSAATGSTGYLWLESEHVRQYGKDKFINKDYYRKLVDEAKADISKYVDPEFFLSDLQPEEKYGPTLHTLVGGDVQMVKPGGAIHFGSSYDGTTGVKPHITYTAKDGVKIKPDFMNIPEGAPEELPWEEVS